MTSLFSYSHLADGVLFFHSLFVLFVVASQFLITLGWIFHWSSTRNGLFRSFHLFAIFFVVLETWIGITCPLTEWENSLRISAQQGSYEDFSFIGYWLNSFLYYDAPTWVFTAVYSLFFLWVLTLFFLYPPRFYRNSTQRKLNNIFIRNQK